MARTLASRSKEAEIGFASFEHKSLFSKSKINHSFYHICKNTRLRDLFYRGNRTYNKCSNMNIYSLAHFSNRKIWSCMYNESSKIPIYTKLCNGNIHHITEYNH